MQIIGNNISNANTIGYKSSDYCFEDLLSQSIATQSGSKIGRAHV
jgi:flagellar hook protein FlgE